MNFKPITGSRGIPPPAPRFSLREVKGVQEGSLCNLGVIQEKNPAVCSLGERKKKAKSEGQWKSVKDECFSGSYLREYIKRDNKLKPRSLLLKGEHLVT